MFTYILHVIGEVFLLKIGSTDHYSKVRFIE